MAGPRIPFYFFTTFPLPKVSVAHFYVHILRIPLYCDCYCENRILIWNHLNLDMMGIGLIPSQLAIYNYDKIPSR